MDQNVNFIMATTTRLSWILSAMGSDGQNYSGTSFSDTVSNLVQIRSKMAEL